MNTFFTGEFDNVLIEATGEGEVIDQDLGLVLPPKNVTELDRLSCTVRTIDHQCQAVPKHSYKFTPICEIKQNEAFKGLSKEEACELKNWSHLRPIQSQRVKDKINRNEAVYSEDFLDSVCEDYPKNSWSISPDSTGTVFMLKSHFWPGYVAYHRCNTRNHGGFYNGFGIKNVDLPFML